MQSGRGSLSSAAGGQSGSGFTRAAGLVSVPPTSAPLLTIFGSLGAASAGANALLWLLGHGGVAAAAVFAAGLVCTMLSVAAVHVLVARPIGRLATEVDDACDMNIDDILAEPEVATPVAEVQRLQESFRSLCKHLREYRSFLPQAVLQEVSDTASPPPQGNVAVVFTDIVGSTALWEAAPSTMSEAMELHDSVVRSAINKHGGYEVKTIGDSFMVCFSDAAAAVLFCCNTQEGLLQAEWPVEPDFQVSDTYAKVCDERGAVVWNGITVRIGVGYGDATAELNPITGRTDYRGRCVNLAARLEGVCPHGGVLVSSECFHAVASDARLRGIHFRRLPVTDLKGIGSTEAYLVTPPVLQPRVALLFRRRPGHVQQLREKRLRCAAGSSSSSSSSNRGERLRRRQSNTKTMQLLTQLQLTQRPGSIAVVSRLDSGSSQWVSAETVRVSAELNRGAELCINSATRTQGTVSSLIGSAAHVTWNVITPCSPHHCQALVFAALVAAGDNTHATGLASGLLMQGNIGTAKQRFHTVTGVMVLSGALLSGMAGAVGVPCLACYLPRVPDSLRRLTRPVDTWACPDGVTTMVTLTVEQPLMADLQKAHRWGQLEAEDFVCATPERDNAGGEGDDWYRVAYDRALQRGCVESLLVLEDALALDPDDRLLRVVVDQMREHVLRYPCGAASRILAPFVAGGGSALWPEGSTSWRASLTSPDPMATGGSTHHDDSACAVSVAERRALRHNPLQWVGGRAQSQVSVNEFDVLAGRQHHLAAPHSPSCATEPDTECVSLDSLG